MENDKVNEQSITVTVVNPCDYVLSQTDTLQSLQNNTNKPNELNLYLGGVSALTPEVLSTHKINSVLTIMTEKQKRKAKLQQKIDNLDDIHRHSQLMCHETTIIAPYFKSAIDFINDSFMYKMNVLIHCKQGDTKSASLVIAYLIYKYKISFEKALNILKTKRPSIKLTQTLQAQLKQDQQKLHQFK